MKQRTQHQNKGVQEISNSTRQVSSGLRRPTDEKLTQQDRINRIIQYVRDHPKTKKANVIDHMTQTKGGSLRTTHRLLNKLISEKRLKVEKTSPTSRDHHLIFNYQDEITAINVKIDRLERFTNELADLVIPTSRDYEKMGMIAKSRLMYILQISFYSRIGWLLNRINNNVKSTENKEALYRRIIQLMINSNRINSFLAGSSEYVTELQELKLLEGSPESKVIDQVITLMLKDLNT